MDQDPSLISDRASLSAVCCFLGPFETLLGRKKGWAQWAAAEGRLEGMKPWGGGNERERPLREREGEGG